MFPIKLDDEMVVVHIDDGKGEDREVHVPDARANKPMGFHDQQDGQTMFVQRLIDANINESKLSIAAPNEIALSLNISKRSVEKSNELRALLKKQGEKEKSKLFEKEVAIAYDYLEEIQKAIVFSYKAVESFCNATIPDDYVYKRTTNKGIEEHYRKEQIERWVNTSEKVSSILPEILEVDAPSQQTFWSDFKNLERIRNEIIHSKSGNSTEILKELFSSKVRTYILSSVDLLHFFIKSDPFNVIFPLGFGESRVKVLSVENVDELFKKAD